VPLLRFDAAAMPFSARSFDVVVLFEALYYLPRPRSFLAECARLLRPGGQVVIATVNPEWRGFHPSPFAQHYFSAAELCELLSSVGFAVEVSGAFRETAGSARERLISRLRRGASAAGLIPKTMRGKEALKRIFFGPLGPLPAEIVADGLGYTPPASIEPNEAVDYTVLYAFGRTKAKP
jgi:SAM-dependent methyltransferase